MSLQTIKKQLLTFPVFFIFAASVGLAASFTLGVEQFHLLENPETELACSINPVYSCESVINSEQASLFGFPNEFLGIAYFGGLLALGLALLSGSKFGQWLYKLTWASMAGMMGFIFWFFYQSVYTINALCIYCSVVWTATWTLFIIYSRWLVTSKTIKVPKKYQAATKLFVTNTPLIWFLLVATFAGLILNHFWYYYGQYF